MSKEGVAGQISLLELVGVGVAFKRASRSLVELGGEERHRVSGKVVRSCSVDWRVRGYIHVYIYICVCVYRRRNVGCQILSA